MQWLPALVGGQSGRCLLAGALSVSVSGPTPRQCQSLHHPPSDCHLLQWHWHGSLSLSPACIPPNPCLGAATTLVVYQGLHVISMRVPVLLVQHCNDAEA